MEDTKEKTTYSAELLIATSPFSNIKVFVNDTIEGIVAKNDWLLKHYEPKQK